MSYTCSDLLPGPYEATITVSDPSAANDPQTIAVTVEVETVICDFDGDGDVDMEDFGHLQVCLNGPGSVPEGCDDADLDSNGMVNQNDVSIFRGCLSGANIVADKTCDDGYD